MKELLLGGNLIGDVAEACAGGALPRCQAVRDALLNGP